MTRRTARAWALAGALLAAGPAGPAAAHHVGAYVPRDNDVTTNFKQLKSSVQAGKFDVALRLFDAGAVRREIHAQAARVPAGLEEGTRAALVAGDAREVERRLMVLFAVLARDLALEGDRQVADATLPREARVATARKFLEAVWRYYNLVDFAVSQRDNKTSTAVRLAFDEAEGYVRSGSKPGTGGVAPDPEKVRAPLRRIAQALSALVETSSPTARRES